MTKIDPLAFERDNMKIVKYQGKTYACTLNQSDLKTNANKFYIIQLLRSTEENPLIKYYLFYRWGRVGYDGVNSNDGYETVEEGIKAYNKKYKEKTKKGYM